MIKPSSSLVTNNKTKVLQKEGFVMYKLYYEEYINSQRYKNIEEDQIYKKLVMLLQNNLNKNLFLDGEELLHEEIIFKLETGFQEGFNAHKMLYK